MLIKKIYIDRFGKLKDRSFEFQEGINVIHGRNEAGKSTLENFILAMFYGARTSRKNDLDARKWYIPYGKDYAFGNMELEIDGREIVVERKIARKKKDDLFRVYEKDTFDQVNLSENLGKELFDVELEEFIKTLYINQNSTRFLNEKDEGLSTKLTNLLETGDEEISFTKAMDSIDREMKLIRGLRKNGKLDELYKELSELYVRLDQARTLEAKVREKNDRLQTLSSEYDELSKQKTDLHQLKDKISLYNVKHEFLRIRRNLEELKQMRLQQDEHFVPIPDSLLKEIREKEMKLKDIDEDILLLEDNLAQAERQRVEADLLLEPYTGYEEAGREAIVQMVKLQGEEMLLEEKLRYFKVDSTMNRNLLERREELGKLLGVYEIHLKGLRPKRYLINILSASLLLTALLFQTFTENLLVTAGLLLLAVAAAAAGKPLDRRRIKHHLASVDRTEAKIAQVATELGMDPVEVIRSKKVIDKLPKSEEQRRLNARYEEVMAHKEQILKLTNTKNIEELMKGAEEHHALTDRRNEILRSHERFHQELNAKHEVRANLLDSYQGMLHGLGFDETKHDVYTYLEEYELKAARMRETGIREEALKYSLKSLIGDRSEEEVSREIETIDALGIEEGFDFTTLEEKERELSEKELRLLDEMNGIRLEKKDLSHEEPLFIEDSILTLQSQEQQLKRRYEILEVTKTLMKESYDKLRKEFTSTLNDKVTKRYREITGNPRIVKVSDLFSMNYQESGMLWQDDYLSQGSMEQLYLSLRLSMSELIFQGRKVPLILDEAFASYDEERLEKVLDHLRDCQKQYQIFIFTCHRREVDILKNDAEIIHLD